MGRTSKKSSSFIGPSNRRMARKKEFFAEGDWLTIQDRLSLSGWDSLQMEKIYHYLKEGLSLSSSMQKLMDTQGKCPLHSRKFF